MKIVLQRVSEASVKVDGEIVGQIGLGLLVLCGIGVDDNEDDIDWVATKMCNMRIFSDEEGKMNRSIKEVEGNFLVISQFTLHASTKKGNRPSFIKAARPERAIPLYEKLVQKLSTLMSKKAEQGIFGADMKVQLLNDGPVTIVLDSKNKI